MSAFGPERLAMLVQRDRVHRSVYADLLVIHDDRTLLELPVKQARNPRAHARLPLARTVHQVGNVMVEEAGGELRVHSTLQLIAFRNEKQRVYGALVEHRLRKVNGSYKIAHKRLDLVNSEGELDGIAVLF